MLEVHVYNSFFGDTKVDQIVHLRDVEIQENLDSFDTLDFKVDYYIDKYGDNNVKHIRDFSRIELVQVSNVNKIIFQGVVVDGRPSKDFMTIKARDFKGLLLKKIIVWDKNYTNSNLSGIMSAILSELNARSSGDTHPENWSVELDEDVTGISIELSNGDTYFDAIKKLVDQIGKYWKVENGVIKISDIVGENKTIGENFTELLYDYNSPEENNITNYEVKTYSTISNFVRVGSSNTDRPDSIASFGRLEEFSTIDSSEVSSYIDKSSEEQKEYILDIDFTRIDTPLQIGDRVAIKIDTAIDKVDFSWDLLITRRKIKYQGTDIVYTSINISDIIIQRNDFTDNLNRYFTDVKNLKLS